jgi:hypothetical protein
LPEEIVMKKLLAGFAALPFLAGVAMAGQPAPLSDVQMDQVTAGLAVWFVPATGNFVVTNPPGLTPGAGVVVANFPSLDGVPPPAFPSVTKGPTIVVP